MAVLLAKAVPFAHIIRQMIHLHGITNDTRPGDQVVELLEKSDQALLAVFLRFPRSFPFHPLLFGQPRLFLFPFQPFSFRLFTSQPLGFFLGFTRAMKGSLNRFVQINPPFIKAAKSGYSPRSAINFSSFCRSSSAFLARSSTACFTAS